MGNGVCVHCMAVGKDIPTDDALMGGMHGLCNSSGSNEMAE